MKIVKLEKSLTEQAYDILLDKICTGELASGERLNQDELEISSMSPDNRLTALFRYSSLMVLLRRLDEGVSLYRQLT